CGCGVCARSNSPNVSSSFLRTRSSGVRASAAIIGPTNSSASRIARASSGVRRGGARNVSPNSSLSTRTFPSASSASIALPPPPLVAITDEPQRARHLPSQLRRGDRRGAPVLSDDPGSKLPGTRVLGHEGAVLHAAVLSVCPLDPPGGVVAHLDPGLAGQIADLPGRAVAV